MDSAFSHRFSWVSMAKLAEEIEETSSDVIGYGMVSYAVMAYADKMWRAMLSSLSRPLVTTDSADHTPFSPMELVLRACGHITSI